MVKTKHNGRGYTGIAAGRCTIIEINSVTNILGTRGLLKLKPQYKKDIIV